MSISVQARRKHATLDDMLYASSDEALPALKPVLETPDETNPGITLTMPPLMSVSAPPPGATLGGEGLLMPPPTAPPPKSLPQRPASASRYTSMGWELALKKLIVTVESNP